MDSDKDAPHVAILKRPEAKKVASAVYRPMKEALPLKQAICGYPGNVTSYPGGGSHPSMKSACKSLCINIERSSTATTKTPEERVA